MWSRALRAFATCIFAIGVADAADLAAPAEYEGKPIREVRFEPQSQPVSRADLARLLPLKPGVPLRAADVRATIKRLFGTGRYASLEVLAEPSGNAVAVVIRTREQWFVGPVRVRGKLKLPPNRGQLANASRLELGTPYDEENLQTALNGIKELLDRNGLYRASVEPEVVRDAEHQLMAFTFQVDAGKRARYVLPEITGEPRLPEKDVAKAAKYKSWFRFKPVTEATTQRGIENVRRKYQKKERLTADVSLDDMEYDASKNRAKPVIDVEGGPKVKIATTGAKVSKSKLQKYVPVFDLETVNRDLLVMGARNLRDSFQNDGYFNAQVDFQTKQINPDQEEITYVVTPGPRRKLVDVSVHGVNYFTVGDIRERMYLQTAGLVRLRHGRYSEGFVRRDQDSIKSLYRDNGFQDTKVAINTVSNYKGKPGNVAVTVDVTEGPQTFVGDLTVNGIARPDRPQILAALSSIAGQPFSGANVAIDRDFILAVYQSTGYLDATFDWKLTPGSAPNTVNIEYNIVEGSRRFVRDVLITGAENTRGRLISPNILLKPGDPLSWNRMGYMQRRLYNLGVFDKVDMAVQNAQGDTENKYVLYNLEEAHRYSLAVGVGAEFARIGGSQTSLDQPAGAAGFSPRGSLEISRLNMFGFGHSLTFKSRYSSLDRRVSLNYYAPRYHNVEGRNISFTALYDDTRDVRTFTAKRIEGSMQLSQRFSKATNAFFRYTWRDVRVDQGTLKIQPLLIPLLSQPVHIGMLSGSLIQDRRDDPTDAHRGIYNTADLGMASHFLGGNKNFVRFLGRNSYYKSVHGNLVLASNTQFGWIGPFRTAPGAIATEYVPIAERFFGGGNSSLRAFPDNQAGPRDSLTGFPLGGNALLFHATELRFPFLGDNMSGVFFHDFGNVYSSIGNISFRFHQKDLNDFDYTVHAVGFGIRYRTPVGPVRVDLAYSINPPTFKGLKGTYEQLLLGTATPAIQHVSHFQFFFSIGQAF